MLRSVTCDRCHHPFRMLCPNRQAEAVRVTCPECGDPMVVFLEGELSRRAASHYSHLDTPDYRRIARAAAGSRGR